MSPPGKKYPKATLNPKQSASTQKLNLDQFEQLLNIMTNDLAPITLAKSQVISFETTDKLFKNTSRQQWQHLLAMRSANRKQGPLASFIDHTYLKPDTTQTDIEKLTNECQKFRFAAACVPPNFVKQAALELKKTKTKPITVIGFPLGYHHNNVKLLEAKQALKDGALELDFVQDVSLIKTKQYKSLLRCFQSWRKLTARPIKVILETSLLTSREIIECAAIAAWAKLDFVKTSTGFGSRGASIDDVLLMHIGLMAAELSNNKLTPHFTQIKASGGIKNSNDAHQYIALGVRRLGTSQSLTIIDKSDVQTASTTKINLTNTRYY